MVWLLLLHKSPRGNTWFSDDGVPTGRAPARLRSNLTLLKATNVREVASVAGARAQRQRWTTAEVMASVIWHHTVLHCGVQEAVSEVMIQMIEPWTMIDYVYGVRSNIGDSAIVIHGSLTRKWSQTNITDGREGLQIVLLREAQQVVTSWSIDCRPRVWSRQACWTHNRLADFI